MRGLLAATVLLLTLAPLAARAAGLAATLPKGETAQQLAWRGDDLLVLVNTPKGPALRLVDGMSGEIAVVTVPRSFSELTGSSQIFLAPSGTGVAALASRGSGSRAWAYVLSGNALDEVNLRSVPRDFPCAKLAWHPQGSAVFVATAPYVAPEQPYAIGRIDLPSGKFTGVVPKGNLDLIDELAYLPGRDVLACKCRGVRGEYPAEPVIALAALSAPEITVLHSAATELKLTALADGTLLLIGPQSSRQRWLLKSGAAKLTALKLRAPGHDWSASADGQWFGLQAQAKDLRAPGAGLVTALENRGSGKTYVLTGISHGLRFAPDGRRIAGLSEDGTRVLVAELPAD